MGKNSRNNRDVRSINFWLFARDVMRDAINKGQGIPYLIGFILVITVVKMPSEEVSKLAFSILEAIIDFRIMGWFLAIIALPGWYIHARWQRKVIHNEMRRIASERTKLQEKLVDADVTSSQSQ